MPAMGNLRLAVVMCAVLPLACGKKADDKKATDQPAPAEQPKPTESAAGGAKGNPLAMLFGGSKATAAKPPAHMSGLFGGGLNLGELSKMGGGAAAADTAAKKADPAAAPAEPKAAPVPDPAPTGGPSCADLAKHIATLAAAEVADAPAELRGQIEPMLTEMCNQQAWPAELRQCVMSAKDQDGLEGCNALLPGGGDDGEDDQGGDGDDDMPDMPDMGIDPDNMPTAPTPSGNADCDAMAGNLVTVIMADQMGSMSADEKKLMEGMKFAMQSQIAQMCATAGWPKEAIQCLGQIKNEHDAEACATKYNLAP